jgi:hypothetical protein
LTWRNRRGAFYSLRWLVGAAPRGIFSRCHPDAANGSYPPSSAVPAAANREGCECRLSRGSLTFVADVRQRERYDVLRPVADIKFIGQSLRPVTAT